MHKPGFLVTGSMRRNCIFYVLGLEMGALQFSMPPAVISRKWPGQPTLKYFHNNQLPLLQHYEQ